MSKVELFLLNPSLNSEDSVSWLQRQLYQEQPDVSESSLVRRDLPKLTKNVYNHVARLWVRHKSSLRGAASVSLELCPTVQTGKMEATVTLNDPVVNTG